MRAGGAHRLLYGRREQWEGVAGVVTGGGGKWELLSE
jgi:hypothetical protein